MRRRSGCRHPRRPAHQRPHDPGHRAVLHGAARLAQRLFCGVLSLDTQVSPLEGELPSPWPRRWPAATTADGAPCTMPPCPIDERMQLAEGRPLPRKLFAAMAHRTAANAATCARPTRPPSPAARRTSSTWAPLAAKRRARMLKRLLEETRRRPIPCCARRSGPTRKVLGCARQSRDAPSMPSFAPRARLNGLARRRTPPRRVRHRGWAASTTPGDSFGLFPSHDPALADAVLAAMRAPPDFPRTAQELPPGADRGLRALARPRHAVRADRLPGRAERAHRRRGCSPRAAIPTATPPASTCWRHWRRSVRSIPTRRRSSSASSRCSRGSIRLRPRRW